MNARALIIKFWFPILLILLLIGGIAAGLLFRYASHEHQHHCTDPACQHHCTDPDCQHH